MKQDKVYLASVKLGIKTNSGDLDGDIISQSDYSHVDIDKIKKSVQVLSVKQNKRLLCFQL